MKLQAILTVSATLLSVASARDWLDKWDIDTDGIRSRIIRKLNDGIGDCKDDTDTHKEFVTCIKDLVRKHRKALDKSEKKEIIKAAEDSRIHKGRGEDKHDSEEDSKSDDGRRNKYVR